MATQMQLNVLMAGNRIATPRLVKQRQLKRVFTSLVYLCS